MSGTARRRREERRIRTQRPIAQMRERLAGRIVSGCRARCFVCRRFLGSEQYPGACTGMAGGDDAPPCIGFVELLTGRRGAAVWTDEEAGLRPERTGAATA